MSDFVNSLALDWGRPLVENAPLDAALAAQVKKILRYVPPDIGTFREVPWLARSVARVFSKPFSFAPIGLIELAALVTAQENACRYCYGSQKVVVRFLGFREEQLERLERSQGLEDLAPKERAVIDFARRLARSNPRPAEREVEALLAAGCDRKQIAEIAWSTGASCFLNRVNTFVALPPLTSFEALPDRPLYRMFRPIVSRFMSGRPIAPPADVAWNGPFAQIVSSFRGTWGGEMLRADLTECFESTILPRTTKLAVFGVVARALGCSVSDGEGCRLLEAEGISASAAEDAVRNLRADWLDDADQKIVAWARDTVQYRSADIQKRTRVLADGIGSAKAMEAIGTASLANQIVRLAMFIER
jgi:alkylhydroperoxidase family enzyme